MAGDDLVRGGGGASVTDVFGTVEKEPVRVAPEPARVAPIAAQPVAPSPVSAPEENPSSGGFTQLLRALNYDAVKEAVKEAPSARVESKAVAPAAVAGPMTQLLRTLGGPAAEASAVEKPVVPPSTSQVTSFLPQSAPPLPVVPAAPAPPVVTGGSFTQLFQRLDAEPANEAVPEKPIEAFTVMPAGRVGAAVRVDRGEPMPAVPVSFTQMFQALDAPQVEPVAVIAQPAAMPTLEPVKASVDTRASTEAPVSTAGSFTQMFQTLDAPPADVHGEEAELPVRAVEASSPPMAAKPKGPAAAPVGTPGSFTQIFRTLDAPAAEPVRNEAPPARVEPAASAPGSFTQMFQAVGTPAAEQARYVPPPVMEAPKQPAASSPGSFTQMFRTLGEEPRNAKEAEAVPGSFTQLFSSPAPPSAPAIPSPPTQPSAYERPFAVNAPAPGESGASQMFATYREPQAVPVERRPDFAAPGFSPLEAAPAGRPPASTPSSGGLTQLLRALDQPTSTPKPYAAPGYAPPVAPAAAPGSFTGVYGELGPPVPQLGAPAAPMAGSQAEVAAGPSEFTRIFNASAMREAALRGGGAAPAASPAASSGGGAGFAMPGGLPGGAHASFAAPAAPSASMSGPAGLHASASAAGGGHAALSGPHLPTVSAAPGMKLPEAPKAGGAPGMQKYLPLLLILVIFLLVAILVAVVVLMKK